MRGRQTGLSAALTAPRTADYRKAPRTPAVEGTLNEINCPANPSHMTA